MGLPLSIFSLKGGDQMLDLWWAFALIWVPLIVVPDSSLRACGGVGILLQRLYVGYVVETLACSLVVFFRGVRVSAPAGCSPRACGGVGILFQRLYAG
jgi:hypothetical protein